jgi:hypothetical protein
MIYRLFADIVVVLHLAFVIFVILGGMLLIWRHRIIWLHLPAVAWAVWIEWTGGICPLTPLENWLRRQAGSHEYTGGFVMHYIVAVLYPEGLTRETQIACGVLVIFINVVLYGYGLLGRRSRN